MDLSEFLLARIADDEAVAVEAGGDTWEVADERKVRWTRNGGNAHGWVAFADLPTATEHIARHDPARVLAECDAKRRIVEAAWADHLRIEGEWGHGRGREELSALNDYPQVVQLVALPYASHPDYREEWRP